MIKEIVKKAAAFGFNMLPNKSREKLKKNHELKFWRKQKDREDSFKNDHYKYFYTDFFSLSDADYSNKKVLDIGCGPRGSLEWANMSLERIGIDPLSDEYLKLGASNHAMKYVTAPSEEIPYSDAYFDIVASFNNLDHCANPSKSINEIARVTKKGGYFLLIVEVNHPATATEPHSFTWEMHQLFRNNFEVLMEKKYEIIGHDIYGSIKGRHLFDAKNVKKRPGIYCVKFQRN